MSNDDWKTKALCRDIEDPDVFFPNPGESKKARKIIEHYCRRCPVQVDCGKAGLDETEGIWGGATPIMRTRLKRQAGLPVASCPGCGKPMSNRNRPRLCRRCDRQRTGRIRKTVA